jgi:hypothetical protein
MVPAMDRNGSHSPNRALCSKFGRNDDVENKAVGSGSHRLIGDDADCLRRTGNIDREVDDD